MNKALIIFKGNYDIEQGLSDDVVDWSYMNLTEGWSCRNCTVNRQAAQAYVEVKEATNDWQEILDAYYNQGLVFSIAGHGFVSGFPVIVTNSCLFLISFSMHCRVVCFHKSPQST